METAVGMKYQKGRVYLSGKRVKMWYGQYLVYRNDQNGKEVRKQRNVRICPKANTPKWKAEQMLQEIILKECKGLGPTPTLPPDDSVTFRWFVKQRYIPMRQGGWSPAYQLEQQIWSCLQRSFARIYTQSTTILRIVIEGYSRFQNIAWNLLWSEFIHFLSVFPKGSGKPFEIWWAVRDCPTYIKDISVYACFTL